MTGQGPNPSGLCMCGCGAATPIAPYSRTDKGWVGGQPLKYVFGHSRKTAGPQYIEEDRGWSTPCWIWQRSLRAGYGQIHVPPRESRPAHRVYYERANGAVPDGLSLDHLCRVRACVNPAHLEPVTQRENVKRGLVGRLKKTCANGHPWIPENWLVNPSTGWKRCAICKRERADAHARRIREEAATAGWCACGRPARWLYREATPLCGLHARYRDDIDLQVVGS